MCLSSVWGLDGNLHECSHILGTRRSLFHLSLGASRCPGPRIQVTANLAEALTLFSRTFKLESWKVSTRECPGGRGGRARNVRSQVTMAGHLDLGDWDRMIPGVFCRWSPRLHPIMWPPGLRLCPSSCFGRCGPASALRALWLFLLRPGRTRIFARPAGEWGLPRSGPPGAPGPTRRPRDRPVRPALQPSG